MWIDGIPNVVIILAILLVLFVLFKDKIMAFLPSFGTATTSTGTV